MDRWGPNTLMYNIQDTRGVYIKRLIATINGTDDTLYCINYILLFKKVLVYFIVLLIAARAPYQKLII